ncbi:MAG: hypothetical protein U9R66_00495 [Thermodesulfobacteriota bacterium]|nr:hypothetical protein [Thermodesulfobacteriota bacterium]
MDEYEMLVSVYVKSILFSGHFAANLHGVSFKVQGLEDTRYLKGSSNREP